MQPDSQPHPETPAEREERYGEFVGLLARHDQAIRRFVRSLLPTPEGVDDVLQETALECWKKFHTFSPTTADDAGNEFVRWACMVARYKALSWQRDRARDRLVFRQSVIEQLAHVALDQLDQREAERQAMERCLNKLSDEERRLVLSIHSPGQSIAQLAAETGAQVRRLYNRVNVLRRRLLECIQQRLALEGGHG